MKKYVSIGSGINRQGETITLTDTEAATETSIREGRRVLRSKALDLLVSILNRHLLENGSSVVLSVAPDLKTVKGGAVEETRRIKAVYFSELGQLRKKGINVSPAPEATETKTKKKKAA